MKEDLPLSVVLAVYNKQNSIPRVYELFKHTIEQEIGLQDYEIIFVDDASADASRKAIQACMDDPRVRLVAHDTNLGQLKTLETGIKAAKGKVLILATCDLQNPIERSTDLYKAVVAGADCALAYRRQRNEKTFNSMVSRSFLLILSILFPKFPKGGFDYAAINSYVRERLLPHDFNNIFLQLEILNISRKVVQFPVTRETDNLDTSSWTWSARMKYALKAFKYIFK